MKDPIAPVSSLTDQEYWTYRYQNKVQNIEPGWYPNTYQTILLEKAIFTGINRYNPQTVLEIGCGDSKWLPYIAKTTGAQVAGVDYSEIGCEMAKRRLEINGVKGNIYYADIFDINASEIGQYDYVYSLGVVEHFHDLKNVVSIFLKFVKPGGALLTELPNLHSVYGLARRLWQPESYNKHVQIRKSQLINTYQELRLTEIDARHWGIFIIPMITGGNSPRWPGFEKKALPIIIKVASMVDRLMRKIAVYDSIIPGLSPYISAIGKKPINE